MSVSPESLQLAWQRQALDAPRINLAYLRHRTDSLRRRSRIRNAFEYVGGVAGIAFTVSVGWNFIRPRPLMSLSIVLWVVTLGIGYVIWGAIVWQRGQTPTYSVLGMRCWRPETREVPGFWWMALREIVGRFVEGILSVITGLVSLILFLTTRERKSLHDYVAGTVVLYDPTNRLAR